MSEREHIADSGALYALGALDADEQLAIEAHVSDCAACARLLADAEADVAAMIAAQPQRNAPLELRLRVARALAPSRRPTSWIAASAIAAALLIGVLPSAYFWQENQATHRAMLADADAMNRLASSQYRVAAFNGMSNGSTARVMYAPDGSWYVIVVRGAGHALQVAWMHDGSRTMLGTAQARGAELAMLYLPRSHRMDQLALMDGEQVVAEAQLAY